MGIIIYDGPSVLDGSPVLGVVTGALERGIQRPTSNKKIAHGYALQLWIVQRDWHPLDALRTGSDAGVCGTCPLRPQADRARLCYVNPMTISQVWKHARGPDAERLTPYDVGRHRMGLARYVRLGAYGDPVALPFEVCDDLLRGARAASVASWRRNSSAPRTRALRRRAERCTARSFETTVMCRGCELSFTSRSMAASALTPPPA
jgi:hypothetical protein